VSQPVNELDAWVEAETGTSQAQVERSEPAYGFHPYCTPTTQTPGIDTGHHRRKLLIMLALFGGRHRARTCDLRVANAALSQLS
jgi:hypothetical protein